MTWFFHLSLSVLSLSLNEPLTVVKTIIALLALLFCTELNYILTLTRLFSGSVVWNCLERTGYLYFHPFLLLLRNCRKLLPNRHANNAPQYNTTSILYSLVTS